jgi:uncharacterized membrane protein
LQQCKRRALPELDLCCTVVRREDQRVDASVDRNSLALARNVSLIPIGLSHLIYGKETAAFVPAWLPFRLGWAYLTGVGQIACGIGVLFSIYPRVAASAEAGMLTLFTLLVWGPAILAAPTTRLPWTAFLISWAITASAWVLANNIATKEAAMPDV